MMTFRYKNLFGMIFAAWIAIWINFMVRDLTKGQELKDYKILLSRNADGRASYVYGDHLYDFLKFCRSELPAGADYGLAGIEDISLESRRSIYYLYPALKNPDAAYIFVFDKPEFTRDGYILFKELDNSRLILNRASK